MKVVEIRDGFGLENLVVGERPGEPVAGPGQVVLRMRAASLNYRDLLMVRGDYNPKQPLPLIPCSDGVGEVVAIGDGVERVQPGDRVAPIFAQRWIAGVPTPEKLRSTLGGPLDGTLAEMMTLDAEGVVHVPEHLTDEEAACLPCAGVTAWNALVTHGGIGAGDTVLVLGTGGVSLFALQLGVLLGARVVVTSSSDGKLERARALGAWRTINYRDNAGVGSRGQVDDRRRGRRSRGRGLWRRDAGPVGRGNTFRRPDQPDRQSDGCCVPYQLDPRVHASDPRPGNPRRLARELRGHEPGRRRARDASAGEQRPAVRRSSERRWRVSRRPTISARSRCGSPEVAVPRWLKWTGIVGALALVLIVVALGVGALVVNGKLAKSLPALNGEMRLVGLSAPVTIERDVHGVPTISGANRADVARATGFLHAQDRFFQMDLLRRQAAGELAEVVGPAVLSMDRRNRLHRLRAVAEERIALLDAETGAVLSAYTEGVNAGLEALGSPPPEYMVLFVEPDPWRPADTLLVVLAMYLELQDEGGWRERNLGLMADLLPPELFDFLVTPGTEWDAPIVGEAFATPPIPPAEVFDLRKGARSISFQKINLSPFHETVSGSNGWAVAGAHTADGRALLANDMHLPLAMPNIWYRVSLVWTGAGGEKHRVTGVTLPGAPPVIVGSNGHVAWGFTNSQVDTSDLVVLEPDGEDGQVYRTPDGPQRIRHVEERIRVKGADDDLLDIEDTIWGPVIDRDHRDRRRVARWVAHDAEGIDLGLLDMERARNVDDALEIATRARIPTQNCQVADRDGRIGWTLMGPLPRRTGFDGSIPTSWADAGVGWDGYLNPEEHPRVVDPPLGRIWTANKPRGRRGDAGSARRRGLRARRACASDPERPHGARRSHRARHAGRAARRPGRVSRALAHAAAAGAGRQRGG